MSNDLRIAHGHERQVGIESATLAVHGDNEGLRGPAPEGSGVEISDRRVVGHGLRTDRYRQAALTPRILGSAGLPSRRGRYP